MSDPFFVRCVSQRDEKSQRVADYVWKAVASLRKTQWRSRAEVEERQMQLFRSLLEHCVRNVPWYREVYAPADHRLDRFQSLNDLTELPIVERRTYQEHSSRFQADSLPRGMLATATVTTSGTSGMPVAVRQTNIVNLWWCALTLRDLEWNGIDPRGRLAVIHSAPSLGFETADMMRGLSQSSWGRPFSEWIETGPSFALDIQCPPEQQLAWLCEVNPDYLMSFPANLDALAQRVSATQTRFPRLKLIQSISEPLPEQTRQRIESAFSTPIRDTYSCQEVGCLASPCPESGTQHVHTESVILEVVDSAGRPVPPGETGRVLLTSLLNYQTPLVRYAIGDEAVAGGSCSCRRGLPTLVRIDGKLRPMLTLPSGRTSSSSGLADRFEGVAAIRQYQLEQTSLDSVTVRLVPEEGWNDSRSSELTGQVREFFEAAIDVRIEVCDRIPPAAGGKTPAFIPFDAGSEFDGRKEIPPGIDNASSA